MMSCPRRCARIWRPWEELSRERFWVVLRLLLVSHIPRYLLSYLHQSSGILWYESAMLMFTTSNKILSRFACLWCALRVAWELFEGSWMDTCTGLCCGREEDAVDCQLLCFNRFRGNTRVVGHFYLLHANSVVW